DDVFLLRGHRYAPVPENHRRRLSRCRPQRPGGALSTPGPGPPGGPRLSGEPVPEGPALPGGLTPGPRTSANLPLPRANLQGLGTVIDHHEIPVHALAADHKGVRVVGLPRRHPRQPPAGVFGERMGADHPVRSPGYRPLAKAVEGFAVLGQALGAPAVIAIRPDRKSTRL